MNEETLLIAVEEARDLVDTANEDLHTLRNILNVKILALQEKQRYLDELKTTRSQRHDEIASSIIKVNMRGTLFEIEKDILTRVDGSYFDVMLALSETTPDGSEASVPVYFIDRSYERFERIISNMSGNELCLEGISRYDIQIVYDNMDYFNLYTPHRVFRLDYIEYTNILYVKVGIPMYCMIQMANGRLCIANRRMWILRIEDVNDKKAMLWGHNEHVRCLALLPDGRLCSADLTIKIWNTSTRKCEMTFNGHTAAVMSLCVLSDTRLCSGSRDTTIKIWNAQSGVCEMTLLDDNFGVNSVVQLADGRICSGSADTLVRIWNLESGICEVFLTGHTDQVEVVIQLRDGRICSGSNDYTIKIWNISSFICERTLTGHTRYVNFLFELFDGRLCSGSFFENDTIRLWNTEDGAFDQPLTGYTGSHMSIFQLKDGRICSAGLDGNIKIWSD